MGLFHVFKIVQMVPNRAKHQILYYKHLQKFPSQPTTDSQNIFYETFKIFFW